ncbi:CPBP family intramembrane metalloprotease [bacterium]|nr:CPBP family intramembrane metalloprotease [bacterium]
MADITTEVAVLLGVLLAGSLWVWVTIGMRLSSRSPILEPADLPQSRLPPFSVAVAIAWAGAGLVALFVNTHTNTGAASVDEIRRACARQGLLFLLILSPLAVSPSACLTDFGLRIVDWKRDLRHGALACLASVLPVVLVLLATLSFRHEETEHAMLQLLREDRTPSTMLWIIAAAVLCAPLMEELIYRVVLQTWLAQWLPPRAALILAALAFSAVHRFPDALPLFPLALILGYLYQQRWSFLAIVVVHSLFNATNLAVLLLSLQPAF